MRNCLQGGMYRHNIQFELESGVVVLLTFLDLVVDSNLNANDFIKIEIYGISS
ncbi:MULTISPECIES: hypothetical protein [Vibrio]|uniref:hypothetical protein n=1 Tax=Vibrio TaxID=662 RepID=UPI0020A2AE6E|nr:MULTISPECIES: hypothetical protein [Vibrio]EJL6784669.1 hypothetical protein [Vibrio alginolyticus]ELA6601606.1 hypothetical protein [Vibrio alginolyticus]ELA8262906.1 hypothetical protein [Vibrio alginolyticus]MCR9534100.1 hypothetical protein [Vibrio alginolyticus]UDY82589.1 hypothetical protein LJY22_14140 [Vibrio diabolicus]